MLGYGFDTVTVYGVGCLYRMTGYAQNKPYFYTAVPQSAGRRCTNHVQSLYNHIFRRYVNVIQSLYISVHKMYDRMTKDAQEPVE